LDNKQNQNFFDNRFWLQLLGDRSRLILKSLSPTETTEVQQTQRFILLFDNLLNRARQNPTEDKLKQLNQEAERTTQDFRKYILHLLKRQMIEELSIDINPATFNMIVNSAEMYLEILSFYRQNIIPSFNSVVLTSKWLQNIYIDTLILQNDIGIMYCTERDRAGEFAKLFLNLYYTSVMLDGLRRTGLDKFPALEQFNDQLQENLERFAEYLVDLIHKIPEKRYIGKISLLFVDSTYRQVCYYMIRLSEVSTIKPPVCDPTSLRRE
jgi:hypothetical protein